MGSATPTMHVSAYNNLPLPPFLDEPGPWFQPYRDKIPGRTLDQKFSWVARQMDLARTLGARGWLVHAFPSEVAAGTFEATYRRYEKLARERELRCGVAWGLDSKDSPESKGERLARVACLVDGNRAIVDINVDDMESHYDAAGSEAEAERLFVRFESACSDSGRSPESIVLVDQPWPARKLHGSFPWRTTARRVDVRAPQWYWEDWYRQHGHDAFEFCTNWFTDQWRKGEAEDRKAGVPVKPLIWTTQGYTTDVDDTVTSLVTCPSQLMWCEPRGGGNVVLDSVATALLARNAIWNRGFMGPRAVFDFQASARLTVDGKVGPQTLRALGVLPYSSANVIVRATQRIAAALGFRDQYDIAA